MLEDKQMVSSKPAVPLFGGSRGASSLEGLSQLLAFREKALAFKIGSAMAAAAAANAQAGGRTAAEKAASDVFEANLDTVVSMGWAYVERYCLDNFVQAIARLDVSLRPALLMLATLFGIKSVLKGSAFFLGSGALTAEDLEGLRTSLHEIYRTLSANGGRLALKLCDGFGIPEPMITAPIAKDWRQVGM